MRFLFSFPGGIGHLEPAVPIARALSEAGHAVAFATHPRMVPVVEARGFSVSAVGADRGPPPVVPLRKPSMEVAYRELRERFAGVARERMADLVPLCERWRPDVVVRDETDFGAALAVRSLGLPWATLLVSAAEGLIRAEDVAPALGGSIDWLQGRLVLSAIPPSLRAAEHPLRVCATGRGDPGGPVYFTLGTVFERESGDLGERVRAGLSGMAVIDTRRGFVPQAEVLPRCSAVVCHGGSGTLVGALAHGLPLVLIPLGADQPLNAARAAELGVARVLDAVEATPDEIRGAVEEVRRDPSYRRAAEALRDEIAALPGPARAVQLLTQSRLVIET
jgi:UDP:flavonoid glycosyltransferase YjiC (YdhE family)